jgi:hypothetical protein
VAKRTSPKPDHFASKGEQWYWHHAQDAAFSIAAAIEKREGDVWLIDDEGERVICTPIDPERIWHQSWLALYRRYPELKTRMLGYLSADWRP